MPTRRAAAVHPVCAFRLPAVLSPDAVTMFSPSGMTSNAKHRVEVSLQLDERPPIDVPNPSGFVIRAGHDTRTVTADGKETARAVWPMSSLCRAPVALNHMRCHAVRRSRDDPLPVRRHLRPARTSLA